MTDPIRPEERNPARNRPQTNDLEETIEKGRQELDEMESDGGERRFVDSGSIHPELDDQTIAPPG